MTFIETEDALRALYSAPPSPAATRKVATRLTPEYRTWIEAAPFMALATVGPEGLDCSPRGDAGPVVHVLDEATVALPDRRGNNRIDSLLNIVRDPRVALMFMVPGEHTVIRLNGTARLTADPDLCATLARDGALPRSVTVVTIGEIYFQCARAVIRAGLWERAAASASAADPTRARDLPSPGAILQAMTDGEIDGRAYDTEWPARAAKSMW